MAVAGRQLERAKAFAEKHGIARAYGTFKELAKDPDVGVAYVCVASQAHARLAAMVLNHGKAAVVEPPLALSGPAKAGALAELAKKKGLFLAEANWGRCMPAQEKLRRMIKNGRIGEPKNVVMSIGAVPDRKPGGGGNKPKKGGKKEDGAPSKEAAAKPNKEAVAKTDKDKAGDKLQKDKADKDKEAQKAPPGKKNKNQDIMESVAQCVHFALAALGGADKPEKVVATPSADPERAAAGGVDAVTVALHFPGGRTATFVADVRAEMPGTASVGGTKGSVEVRRIIPIFAAVKMQ